MFRVPNAALAGVGRGALVNGRRETGCRWKLPSPPLQGPVTHAVYFEVLENTRNPRFVATSRPLPLHHNVASPVFHLPEMVNPG